MKTVFEHSAGGIVITPASELVAVRTTNLKGESVLALPKGRVEEGETPLDAAVREIREETGYEVEPSERAPHSISYWFVRRGTRVRKRVDFFCFSVVGGDPADHDWEIEEVVLLPLPDGAGQLTYRGEREAVAASACD